MSVRNDILDDLRRGHDGDPWHGSSARAILAGITAEEAAVRPIADAHTIWEIVLHVTAWTGEVARRLERGSGNALEASDWPALGETTDPAWRAALDAHAEAHRRLVAALSTLPETRLDQPFGHERDPAAGSGMSYAAMLHGLAQHDAYHMGQVALLKKAARGA